MKTRVHLSVDIRGFLDLYKRKSLAGIIMDDNGKKLNDSQAREYLYKCLGEGKRVLPTADCEGFDYQKGCPGHPMEE